SLVPCAPRPCSGFSVLLLAVRWTSFLCRRSFRRRCCCALPSVLGWEFAFISLCSTGLHVVTSSCWPVTPLPSWASLSWTIRRQYSTPWYLGSRRSPLESSALGSPIRFSFRKILRPNLMSG